MFRAYRNRLANPTNSPSYRQSPMLRPSRRPLTFRPGVEGLEPRLVPARFLVINSLDNLLPGSLRYAITQANMAGSRGSTVAITPQVTSPIVLTNGELPINVSMTIRNDSGAPVEIRQATANARVLHIGSGAAAVTVTGVKSASPITLDGGSVTGANGGGILEDGSTDLTLTSVAVISNSVAADANGVGGSGGGVYAAGGTITLDGGSSVMDNQAPDGFGGGINMEVGTVIVRGGSHVDGNSARDEGGIRVGGVEQPGSDAVRVVGGSTVNGNSSTAVVNPQLRDFGGGGIAVETTGSVYVSASQVSDNGTVGMYSGGIVVGLGDVTVTDGSQITGNTNQGPGGGIAANFGGTVIISGRSQVSGNTGAAIGGGIVNFSGPLGSVTVRGGSQVDNNILTNTESIGQAIAVFLEYIRAHPSLGPAAAAAARAARAAEDRLTPPDLLVGGGGIGTLAARISVTGASEVNGNLCGRRDVSAPTIGLGGGIFSVLSRVAIDHSAVENNQAPYGDGGGIYHASRILMLNHATITGNSAAGDGGGIWNGGRLRGDDASILKNTAGGDGGGLFNADGGRARLVDSAFTGNSAGDTGGGIADAGHLVLIDTLFADNTPDDISRV
jgi:fibronectin-binding autotransporter adhesin